MQPEDVVVYAYCLELDQALDRAKDVEHLAGLRAPTLMQSSSLAVCQYQYLWAIETPCTHIFCDFFPTSTSIGEQLLMYTVKPTSDFPPLLPST